MFATYRSDSALEELKAIPNVYPIKMDVTDPADLERAYEIVANKVGEDGLYALLNNAGIAYSAPFEFVDEKHAREVMDTNFMAPYPHRTEVHPVARCIQQSRRREITCSERCFVGGCHGFAIHWFLQRL